MKLLTLALPVYNGEECILETLNSILIAKQKLTEEEMRMLEIVISDNNSNDKTSSVIQNFLNNKSDIHYYRNKNNMGFDANIDTLVKYSRAKYIWFLGCGEVVKKDTLSRLLNKLNSDIEYTNILLEFDIYDENKRTITDTKVFNFKNEILIKSKNDFSYPKYGQAISSNIINRKKWLMTINNKLIVDGWVHIERILDMIALDNNAKSLLLPNPFFTLFREKNGWWTRPNRYMFLLSHIEVLQSMKSKGFNQQVVSNLISKQSRFALLIIIIESRMHGMNFNTKVFNDMLKVFKYDCFFWIFAFPLLIVPKKILVIFRTFFNILQRLKSIIK